MGLSFFNQRRAREAERAKAAINAVPAPIVEEVQAIDEEIKPVEVEEVKAIEVEEPQQEAPKTKKTDAEKLKKKKQG